jgi:hypothetical protein
VLVTLAAFGCKKSNAGGSELEGRRRSSSSSMHNANDPGGSKRMDALRQATGRFRGSLGQFLTDLKSTSVFDRLFFQAPGLIGLSPGFDARISGMQGILTQEPIAAADAQILGVESTQLGDIIEDIAAPGYVDDVYVNGDDAQETWLSLATALTTARNPDPTKLGRDDRAVEFKLLVTLPRDTRPQALLQRIEERRRAVLGANAAAIPDVDVVAHPSFLILTVHGTVTPSRSWVDDVVRIYFEEAIIGSSAVQSGRIPPGQAIQVARDAERDAVAYANTLRNADGYITEAKMRQEGARSDGELHELLVARFRTQRLRDLGYDQTGMATARP